MSITETAGPGMRKDDCLHETGWQNIDNPLYIFHLHQEIYGIDNVQYVIRLG